MAGSDKFGQFIIAGLRDKAIEQFLMLLRGQLRGKAIQSLQAKVAALPPDQKNLLAEVMTDVIDTTLHDLLFALQDAHDRGLGIEVLVDGKNIAAESGMLHGEHLGPSGWIARFSRFPERPA